MYRFGLARTKQEIAYFSRPGRDLNHRVIAEVLYHHFQPASVSEVEGFMADRQRRSRETALPAPPHDRPLGSFRIDWWPVGQGLFSTGVISSPHRTPFVWAFDCGTVSPQPLLATAIGKFREACLPAGMALGLAALSHFDRDHISGFVRLLESTPVRHILLPYLPLAHRLLVALAQGIDVADPLFAFYFDPSAYLLQRSPGARVIYVTASEPGSPIEPMAPDTAGPGGSGRSEETKLDFDEAPPPGEANGDRAIEHQSVSFLRPGGRLIAQRFWEFVPYNDGRYASKASAVFAASIAPHIARLKRGSLGANDPAAINALQKIKGACAQLGRSGRARNAISLFLFSGPLGEASLAWSSSSRPFDAAQMQTRFSQMHTGDASLSDLAEYTDFERFYGPYGRLARAGIFQVMHHGSTNNWFDGLAGRLQPTLSLFCSEPSRGKEFHPDAAVLRDFWPYHATQIDSANGLTLCALMVY